MAAPKCYECARWSKTGCAFEMEQYQKYRDCTLDRREYWMPIQMQETRCEDDRSEVDKDRDGYI